MLINVSKNKNKVIVFVCLYAKINLSLLGGLSDLPPDTIVIVFLWGKRYKFFLLFFFLSVNDRNITYCHRNITPLRATGAIGGAKAHVTRLAGPSADRG